MYIAKPSDTLFMKVVIRGDFVEITIEMACTVNGFIAEENGSEEFLSNRNYDIMLEFLRQYDVLIWGRKTFDNVNSWGKKYLEDLKNINVIILSKNTNISTKLSNIIFCSSIEECLEYCNKNNYKRVFISGGATINNLFMERNIVDKIILNYNPYVLGKGIPLFNGNHFENKLKLDKIVSESEDIVQVHYEVVK